MTVLKCTTDPILLKRTPALISASMPRPREFDPEKVLDKAMQLFWRKGYDATSIADLVAAMGINRFSIYNTFGDKHALFVKVLERYSDCVVTALLGPVEAPDASLPQMREFFDRFVAGASTRQGQFGCLMTNSAAELGAADAVARRVVAAHFQRQQAAFRNALGNAVAAGEVRPDIDIEYTAESFTIAVQGLGVYLKVRPDAGQLARYVDGLFAPLAPASE